MKNLGFFHSYCIMRTFFKAKNSQQENSWSNTQEISAFLCDTIEFRAVQGFYILKYQISWGLSFLALKETHIIVEGKVYLPKVRGIQEVTQGRLVISIHVFFRANQSLLLCHLWNTEAFSGFVTG